MGCGRNISNDMLCMALFCTAINDVLLNFCEGQSHAELWIRVRGAIKFLDYYPERKRKDPWDLPKYGFRGNVRQLTYEQLVATQNFLKENEERLLQTKKKLPLILYLKLSPKQRREAALYCIELFSGLNVHFLYYCEFPPDFGMPKGVEELCQGLRHKSSPKTKRA